MTDKVVAIVSGGLDSATLVYHLKDQGYDVDMVSFDYGQRHRKELIYARALSETLKLQHDIIDLSSLTHLISNSALTSAITTDGPDADARREVEVPEGHYAEDNMKQTVVPNRNMIMLSIAAGIAVNRKANWLATGVHAGDHFIYPDCRPRFIAAANAAIVIGNSGFGAIPETQENELPEQFILAPFLHISKAEIAYRALELEVPLHMTWSCYKGGTNHCGRCGTCVERLEAIDSAMARMRFVNLGLLPSKHHDWTTYDDEEFWKVEIAKGRHVEEVHDDKDYSQPAEGYHLY